MTDLIQNLTDIVQDIQNGSSKLVSLVHKVLKDKDINTFREIFRYLQNSHAAASITSSSIDKSITFIKTLSTPAEQVNWLYTIMIYICGNDQLYAKYENQREEFVKLCQSAKKYLELANFYDNEPFNVPADELGSDAKILDHIVFVADSFITAGDLDKARKKLNEATKYFFPKTTPMPIQERYYNFRANLSIAQEQFKYASSCYYTLYSIADEKKQSEYLRLSAVYAILTQEVVPQKQQITKLLNDERTQSLPIFGLLELFNKKTLVTNDDLKKYIDLMKNEKGFSEENLKKIVQQLNMDRVSNLFTTISFDRLAQIIGSTPDEVVKNMIMLISNKSINALIDQPNKMIIYKKDKTEQERKDLSIDRFCKSLQSFTASLPA